MNTKKNIVICIVISSILFSNTSTAQLEKPSTSNWYINASTGKSIASTGDMRGMFFSVGLMKEKRKLTYMFDILTTLHDGKDNLFFTGYRPGVHDGSVRYSTGGIQVTCNLLWHIINTDKHKFKGGIGGGIRYQSSSMHDGYAIFYPGATGLNFPVIVMDNREPMRTISVLPMVQFNYQYKINSKWVIGAMSSFQIDTNGDNFLNYGIKAGYQIKIK